jgi:tetratricopeptide (TPR) repeat protein
MGVLYTDIDFKKKGIGFYEEALKLYQKLAYKEPELYTHYVATTTHNLGVIYDEMSDFDTAMEYYQKALDMRRELAKKEPVAFNMDTSVTILNIVTLYHARLEKEKDLKYQEPALELLREAESRLMLAESDKPVIKSMKNDLEYFREFFEEIDMKTLMSD